jgi:hypothetical protein
VRKITERIRRISRFSVFVVVTGLLLIAGGLFTGLRASEPSVPDWADAQIRTPTVDIYADGVLEPLYVHADFTTDTEYLVTIFPADDTQPFNAAPLPPGAARHISIVVNAFEQFSWTTDPGLAHVELEATGDAVFESRPTNRTHGVGKQEVFIGTIESDGIPLVLRLTPSQSFVQKSGPYVRVTLPGIGSQPETYVEDAGPLADRQAAEEAVTRSLTIGRIDSVDYTPAMLFIRAITSPFEARHVDWTLHRSTPAPVGGQPTTWEEELRFLVDVVYRDLGWERGADRRVLLGGVLLGLGTALITIPLGLRRSA